MDISTAALMSIVALFIVVIISCVKDDLNVGFLGIGAAILVGGIWADMPAGKILKAFPLDLIMILIAVMFLFSMASANGTMGKVTDYSIRMCKGNPGFIPVVIFCLGSFISMIGPGNIATCAMLAPVAMSIGKRIGISPFLMTLLVVGACTGTTFSPFATSGIISNGLIAGFAADVGIPESSLAGIAWKVFFNCFLAQGIANIGGFLILGGFAWAMHHKSGSFNIDEIAPKPAPFDRNQKITLAVIAVMVVLVVLSGVPVLKVMLPKAVLNMFTNVGTIVFLLDMVMLLTGAGDSGKGVKGMPWNTIMMLAGMYILIDVMDKAGGLNALVQLIASISGEQSVHFFTGTIAGIISAYSSSTGVVMPMFLAMVPGLVNLTGADPIALISTVDVASHLVDTSPLSTLGAICMASAPESEDKGKLFRNLLIWGLSMSIVAGLLCMVLFGIIGI